MDKWIVYGKVGGKELFSAKELTVQPGTKATVKDNGAYGLIAVQGSGTINGKRLQTPAMIRYGELTEDEYFVGHGAARDGATYDNTGTEPLVVLRYFGPGVHGKTLPNVGKCGIALFILGARDKNLIEGALCITSFIQRDLVGIGSDSIKHRRRQQLLRIERQRKRMLRTQAQAEAEKMGQAK